MSDTNQIELINLVTLDIRRSLSNIQGFSGVLKEGVYGSLEDKQLEYVGIINESSKFAIAKFNDLIELTKFKDRKEEELCYEEISIKQLVESCAGSVRQELQEKGVHLIISNKQDINLVRADKRLLHQMLLSLVINAVEYTEVGSVVIIVGKTSHSYTFTVHDTGRGLNSAKPEQNVDISTWADDGLRLLLVRKYAELHGGWISIHSALGLGTSITVAIPNNL